MSASLAGLPYAMHRIPVDGSCDTRRDPGMNGLHQKLQIFNAGVRRHAVAEIEDVTGAASGLTQDVTRPGLDEIRRTQKYPRIEVALDAALESDAAPALIEGHAPVEGDDVR